MEGVIVFIQLRNLSIPHHTLKMLITKQLQVALCVDIIALLKYNPKLLYSLGLLPYSLARWLPW